MQQPLLTSVVPPVFCSLYLFWIFWLAGLHGGDVPSAAFALGFVFCHWVVAPYLSDDRSDRDIQEYVFTAPSTLGCALAVPASVGLDGSSPCQLVQTGLAAHGLDVDGASRSSISSIRRAVGDVFFSQEGDAAVATISGGNGQRAGICERCFAVVRGRRVEMVVLSDVSLRARGWCD